MALGAAFPGLKKNACNSMGALIGYVLSQGKEELFHVEHSPGTGAMSDNPYYAIQNKESKNE